MINEIFIRTSQILGEDGFKKLQNASVAVFGLGGVGSHCAEALARSGVGKLFLIDSLECIEHVHRESFGNEQEQDLPTQHQTAIKLPDDRL